MIEVFFICWLVLLPGGDAFCYCENESPPSEITVSLEHEGEAVPSIVPPNHLLAQP